MVRHSPKKGDHLDHRDLKRTRLALAFLAGGTLRASEIGQRYYQGLAPASLHKTFKRDREELEGEGIFLKESTHGTSKSWALDSVRSTPKPPKDERSLEESSKILGVLMRPLVGDPETANHKTLGLAIARLSLSSGAGTGISAPATTDCDPEVLSRFAMALHERKPLEIEYEAATEQRASRRELRPYGLFSLGGSTYAVAMRKKPGEKDAVRTFNLSRVTRAEVLVDESSYEIPDGFSIEDWRLLPFEIGSERPQDATFYVPRARVANLPGATRNRGTRECHKGGSVLWTCPMRNTGAAAKWAIENGLIPQSPDGLVRAWAAMLEGVDKQ